MLDLRPPLPLRFRLWNKVAHYLRADRLRFASLDEEHLHRAAIKEIGLTDFGDPYYREGLLALIESAKKDANLNFMGRVIVHAHIVRSLANRLLLEDTRRRTPDVFQRPLIPPIIVVGLARSGTTLLHRMLALDPAHRGIPAWELMYPLPRGTPDRRRETVQKGFRFAAKMNPERDVKHPTGVDEPEECILLQTTTFASAGFMAVAPVFSYSDWYISQDLHKAYGEYRMLLQVLQAVDPERRLALKTPAHTRSLSTLLDTIPDALIIQTHRDPVPCVPSACSLVYSAWGMVTDRIDVPRMAEVIIKGFDEAASATLRRCETNPDIVYDVYYDRLIDDPIGTVKEIYNHFGLLWSDTYEERLKVYVRDNPQNKYGKHHYCAEDFGLKDDAIAVHFTEYRRRFGFTE